MLVDSHCHLDRLNLKGYEGDLSLAVQAATDNGVGAMLCVCISEDNRQQVLDIAQQFPHIHASVGVHPCDVEQDVVSVATLMAWLKESDKIVALGETGLDYFHSDTYVEQQKLSFQNHLTAASELQLPVIVHTRDARDDTMALIREYGDSKSSGVLHCFTENWEMAKQALDLGYYISLSGIVTFKNALELKDVAKKIPIDRLLIETDSPYLAPVPFRGKPNEPKYLRNLAEYLAELRGLSLEALAEVTTNNYYNLFKRALPRIA